MTPNIKTDHSQEWACRILLTLHVWATASGYIVFYQTKYQVVSPLVQKTIIDIISEPYFAASILMAATLLAALWLYFFKQRLLVIIISSISILSYKLLVLYFV